MDDKIKKLTELKAQRTKLDEDITTLKTEVQAEMDAVLKSGKTRKKREPNKQLSLIK